MLYDFKSGAFFHPRDEINSMPTPFREQPVIVECPVHRDYRTLRQIKGVSDFNLVNLAGGDVGEHRQITVVIKQQNEV